jgi:hypothetical protein
MSNKSLAILGIVAAATVILAAVLSGVSSGPREGAGGPAYLIQGLDPAAIGSIVVGTGENAVKLQRMGKNFVVANKDGYPADTKTINELISKCADMKTTGAPHTTSPANHADLEVTEEKARSVVKFFTPEPNSSFLTGVAVGKSTEAAQGTYVRLLPTDKVYITLESPWIRDRAIDYIDQELITAKQEDVNSVTVTLKSGGYTLKQNQDKAIVLENIPSGKTLKTSEARSVLIALTDLRFEDVKKSVGGLVFDDQYVCRLNDSLVYTLGIAKKDDKTYAVCKADFTGERPSKVSKTESEEELKKKEALLLAYDKAQEFTARHTPWIYEIADWKAKNLNKALSDLLEDEKKPQDPNAAKPVVPALPTADKPVDLKPPTVEDANTVRVAPPAAGVAVPEPNASKVADPNAAKP